MESSPHHSTGFHALVGDSETESILDQIEMVHSVHFDKDHTPTVDDAYVPVVSHKLYKSLNASAIASSQRQKYRVLGTLSVVGITYMVSASGPVGTEPLISAGGPLIGLLSIAAYFLLCQIPIALMVTELCCAFPENGGFAVWTMAAFGPYWGFQAGYWAWVTSSVTNAVYPGLIYHTVSMALGVEVASGFVAYLIKVAIALLLTLPSFLGVRFVGVISLIIMTLVLAITAIYSVWGLSVGDGAFFRLRETRAMTADDPVDWSMLLRVLFIDFDRLQWVSMIGGELRNPARTYPRVIFFTVALSPLVFIIPLITTVIGDQTPWREIAQGSYAGIASALGGPFLHGLVVFLTVVTFIGLFANSVFLESFLLQGMAEAKLVPKIFSKRNERFQSPTYAVLASMLTMVVMLTLNYDTLLDLISSFSCATQIMIVLSMLQLRRTFPNLHSPMRVPGNSATLVVMLLTPFCVFLFIIGSTLMNWEVGRYIIAVAVPGLALPSIRRRLSGLRICG